MGRRLLFALLTLVLAVWACQPSTPVADNTSTANEPSSPMYDADLANALGADDYGMRPYVMAFLKRGPNQSLDSLAAANLQIAHLDNIKRLASEDKLVVAGPFLDYTDIRGIYIFAVATVAAAEALTATDAAIQAGTLTMELHPWYGSAAIMQVNGLHPRIAKKQI